MIGLVVDENFNNDVLRGMFRRERNLDIVRVQDVGLRTIDDECLLEWAASKNRVTVSHDVSTLTAFAYARATAGKRMPGLVEVPRFAPVSRAIDDLLILALCSEPGEWEGQVLYLPLK